MFGFITTQIRQNDVLSHKRMHDNDGNRFYKLRQKPI